MALEAIIEVFDSPSLGELVVARGPMGSKLGAVDVTKPYQFVRLGDVDGPKPYAFIRSHRGIHTPRAASKISTGPKVKNPGERFYADGRPGSYREGFDIGPFRSGQGP